MAESSGSGARVQVFQQQPNATISQANPVSATLYEVLATTANVRIINIGVYLTWAVTQPTPLEIIVTIDGVSFVFKKTNPATDTAYEPFLSVNTAENDQPMATASLYSAYRAFLLEGRSVRVQVRITWAVTQPTPLVCIVKYAKIP